MQSAIVSYNRIIDFLKYPIVLVLLVSVPFMIPKLFEIIQIMIRWKDEYYPLLVGIGIYIIVWKVFIKNIANGWFSTFEHELTHSIFALATFHKVTNIKVTASNGGHMNYCGVGGGNWLITIAPYFSPTLSALVLVVMYLAPTQFHSILLGILGFSMAFHMHSTWHETHYGQTDLKEVGFTFAWIFLPAANVLANIMFLSLIPNDNIYLSVVMGKYYDYCMVLFGIIF
ncbi:MAG: M50 family metallopeptidase [Campylobacterota bacterium]|nr:M50 family metallopeptidase [Campylobacterota bacterium]